MQPTGTHIEGEALRYCREWLWIYVACINHVSGPTANLRKSPMQRMYTMEQKKPNAYLFQHDAPFHLCRRRITKHIERFYEVICIRKHLGASPIVHALLLEIKSLHACAVTALKPIHLSATTSNLYMRPTMLVCIWVQWTWRQMCHHSCMEIEHS